MKAIQRTLWLAFWALAGVVVPSAAEAQGEIDVRITAPQDGAMLTQVQVDVTVAFGPAGNKNIKIDHLDLLVQDVVAARFDVPNKVDSGTHVFPAVDLSAYAGTNQFVRLVARAATNRNGNRFVDSATVQVKVQAVVDATPPQISGLTPADGAFVANPRPALAAVVTDAGGSGVDPASIVLTLDGAPVARTLSVVNANLVNASFTPPADLANGSHTLSVAAKDLAGNSAVPVSVTFLVDAIAPVATVTAPLNGSLVNQATPPLSGVCSDAGGSGLDLATIVLRLDGSPLAATVTSGNPNSASVSFTPASPLTPGGHTLTLDCSDRAGNASAHGTSSFIVDVAGPVITILAPADGSSGDNTRPPLSATLTDGGGSGVNPGSVVVRLDGGIVAAVVAPSGPGNVSVSFTPGAPLALGSHTYSVAGSDLAGNPGTTRTSTFTITNAQLVVANATIPPGGFVNTATPTYAATLINPQGSGIDPNSIVVRMDGTPVANLVRTPQANGSVDISFIPNPPLAGGPHVVTIDATTLGGTPFATFASAFTVDLIAPVVTGLAPTNGSLVPSATPTITATITDAGGSGIDPASVRMLINGVPVTPLVSFPDGNTANLSFVPPLPLPQGSVTLSADARDRAGNASATATSTIVIDSLPPGISISLPADGSTQADVATTVSLTMSDAGTGLNVASVLIALNGVNVTGLLTKTPGAPGPYGGPLSLAVTGSLTAVTGPNLLEATVLDIAGNSFTKGVIFTVEGDTVPPQPSAIQLSIVSGQGQQVNVWKATEPLVVRATFVDTGEPAPSLGVVFDAPNLSDVLSQIGAIGLGTNSAGEASVRYIPSRSGAQTINVRLLGDDTVAPVQFSVSARLPTMQDRSTPGTCNTQYSLSEYPGSAVSRLMTVQLSDPDGTPMPNQTVIPEITRYEGAVPSQKVGEFFPHAGVTGSDGKVSFAFVIDQNILPNSGSPTPGEFIMVLTAPKYEDSDGNPLKVTYTGTVLDPNQRFNPKVTIDYTVADQSGQGQVGIPNHLCQTTLKVNAHQTAAGFRVIEGEGSFEAGDVGFAQFPLEKFCGQPDVIVFPDRDDPLARANIRFKPLTPGPILVAVSPASDVFVIAPPEVQVVGPVGTKPRDFYLPADFRALAEDRKFRIQVVAPNGLQDVPTVDVVSRTASDEALPATPTDVGVLTSTAVPTTLVESDGRRALYQTGLACAFPDHLWTGDAVPTPGALLTFQISEFGQLGLEALLAQQRVPRRVEVLHPLMASANPAVAQLFHDSGGGTALVQMKMYGTAGSPAAKNVRWLFGDGTESTVAIGNVANHTYAAPNNADTRRLSFPVQAIVLDKEGEAMALLNTTARIAHTARGGVLPNPGPGAGQAALQSKLNDFGWNAGEVTRPPGNGTPPDRFNNAAPPVIQPGFSLVDTISSARNPFATQSALVKNFTRVPGVAGQRAIYTNVDLVGVAVTYLDFRNFDVMGAAYSQKCWNFDVQELASIERHEAMHVFDCCNAGLFNPNYNAAGVPQANPGNVSGNIIRVVYDHFRRGLPIPGDDSTLQNKNQYQALADAFTTVNVVGVPQAFMELEPNISQVVDHRANVECSHFFLTKVLPVVTKYIRICATGLPAVGYAPATTHFRNQYQVLLTEFPELRHQSEFRGDYNLPDPP